MKGLEIKISNTDLVLSNEDKYVKLFTMFKDNKYGTKYIIYADKDGKILYFGNPSVTNKRLVIMKFKDIRDAENVKDFVWSYINNQNNPKYTLIDLPEIDKLEIIDSNTLDVKEEYITKLIDIFFKEEDKQEEIKIQQKEIKKKNMAPFISLFVLIILGIGAYYYLSNNSELIQGKNIYYECKANYENTVIKARINETVDITFSNSRLLKSHNRDIVYKFLDNDMYYEFKEKGLQTDYIPEASKGKFNDEDLTYSSSIVYDINNDNFPRDYDGLLEYYQSNNYTCNLIEK